MAEEKGFSGSAMILSFLLGGAIGAVLGLVLAPTAGQEARERLKKIAEEASGKVKETLEGGKGLLEEGRSIIAAVYEAGKEAMKKEKEKLLEETREDRP